jgi:hypothetical protein
VALLNSSSLSVMKYTRHGSATLGTGVKAVRQVWQKKRRDAWHASQNTRPPSSDVSERTACGDSVRPRRKGTLLALALFWLFGYLVAWLPKHRLMCTAGMVSV